MILKGKNELMLDHSKSGISLFANETNQKINSISNSLKRKLKGAKTMELKDLVKEVNNSNNNPVEKDGMRFVKVNDLYTSESKFKFISAKKEKDPFNENQERFVFILDISGEKEYKKLTLRADPDGIREKIYNYLIENGKIDIPCRVVKNGKFFSFNFLEN